MTGYPETPIVDAVTNTVVQNIAKALLKKGCKGGLGDSRALRSEVRDQVEDILLETGVHDIEKLSALMATTVPNWVSRVLGRKHP